MKIDCVALLFALGLSFNGASAFGADTAPPQPLAVRLATQNALFEEQYQADLRAHPDRATSYGDYRYNDQLDDASLAAIAYNHATDESFIARLAAISTDGFGEQDRLSHDLMIRLLKQHAADYGFKEYEMPVSQMSGPHVALADVRAARQRQALRGLHRPAASDPPCLRPD